MLTFTQALFHAPHLKGTMDQTVEGILESCDPFLRASLSKKLPKEQGVVDSVILAQCYSNRSAALFHLNQYEVSTQINLMYILYN